MGNTLEWSIITVLAGTVIFFLRDVFVNRATKKDLVIVQTDINNAYKKSEEAYKLASESVIGQNDITKNYLSRFEEVKSIMNDNHTETLTAISALSVDLNRNFVQLEECREKHRKLSA